MNRAALYKWVCVLVVFGCTRQATPATDASARVIDPSDSTWYVPPGGCEGHNAYVAPAESLRIAGFFGDTVKDLNAREAAFARVFPVGTLGSGQKATASRLRSLTPRGASTPCTRCMRTAIARVAIS